MKANLSLTLALALAVPAPAAAQAAAAAMRAPGAPALPAALPGPAPASAPDLSPGVMTPPPLAGDWGIHSAPAPSPLAAAALPPETPVPPLQPLSDQEAARVPIGRGDWTPAATERASDGAGSFLLQASGELPAEKLSDPSAAGPTLDRFYEGGTGTRPSVAAADDAVPGDSGLGSAGEELLAGPPSRTPPPPAAEGRREDPSHPVFPALVQAAAGTVLSVLVLSGQLGVWPASAMAAGLWVLAWAVDHSLFRGRLRASERGKEMALLSRDMTKAMAGVLFLAPLLGGLLSAGLAGALSPLGVDPSAAAPLLAVDMGGYPLAKSLAVDPLAGLFNGLVVSSMLGATLVFTIPFSFALLRSEDKPFFAKGLSAGLVTIAPGALLGALMMGLSLGQAAALLAPTAALSGALFLSLRISPERTVAAVIRFGEWVQRLSYLGLALGLAAPVLAAVLGFALGTAPVLETFGIILSVLLVMAAVLPLVGLLQRWLGAGGASLAGLITTLVVIAPMVGMYHRMSPSGKILNAAFAVSAAWIFADHLAFVLTVEPGYLLPVLVSKAAAGLLSLPVAWWVARPSGRRPS